MTRGGNLAVIGLIVAMLGAGTGVAETLGDDWHKFCLEQHPTNDERDALPFIMAFRDLPAHCLEDGLKTRVSWSQVAESVPLDVASVALEVDDPKENIDFERLPTIRLNPIVRDLYCHRTSTDWAQLQRPCPLPSVYAPPTVGLALIGWGPLILLERGLPYDVTLSGAVARIHTPNGRLFTKSITFDRLTASLVELDHLVIVGDLVLNRAQIRHLELHDTIVVGKVVLADSSTEFSVDDFNANVLKGLVVHGGIELSGSSKIEGCQAKIGDGTHSISGPLLLQRC